MILSGSQIQEFDDLTAPVIKWLNENCHPHVSVHIDNASAELAEGITRTRHEEFWRD